MIFSSKGNDRMRDTLPAGFTIKRPTLDDIPVIYGIFAARAESEGQTMDISEADMRNFWQMPGFDPALDAWLVLAPDGSAAAVANIDTHDPARMFVRSGVHPNYNNQGLFANLLELAQERTATRISAAPPDARVTLNAFCQESNSETRQELERTGFVHVRSNWIMLIEMEEEPPTPVWPEGIALRPFTMDMLRAVFEASDEAFQDHWGHVPQEFERWQTWSVKRAGFDAALWFIAYAGEEILALHCAASATGKPGWVN
jgi:mycothiol synthase